MKISNHLLAALAASLGTMGLLAQAPGEGDRRPVGNDEAGQPPRRFDGHGERPFRPDGQPGQRPPQRGPQEFRDGDRGPQPQGLRPVQGQPPEMKLQPFLGIVTRGVPAELTMHLKLPEGFGLIVDDVLSDGPAKAAGILTGDLLRMLDDQWLANPPQLEALVRKAGKDKEVVLTLLREGTEQKVTVKIGERMLPVRRPLPMGTGLLNEGRGPFPLGMGGPAQEGGRQPFRPERGQPEGDGQRQIRYAPERARVVRRDDSGTYELGRVEGVRTFTARKPDNSVAWTGPVETEEQREAMPEEVLRKFEEIEKARPLERIPRPPGEPGPRREPRPDAPRPPGPDGERE